MTVVVLTVTKRPGGLGEQYHWLCRQDIDFVWMIVDDLFQERKFVVEEETKESPFEVWHLEPPPKPEGYWSNLAGLYNFAFDLAVEWRKPEMIISLQDYILLPAGALHRMVRAQREHISDLITGLVSYSETPTLASVVDRRAPWTIFGDVSTEWPSGIYWKDVREDGRYPVLGINESWPTDWELNWASMPGWQIEKGLRFDPAYGKHIGYENHDFAYTAQVFGAACQVDTLNPAISLPHQLYWPLERLEYTHHSQRNFSYHENKYELA